MKYKCTYIRPLSGASRYFTVGKSYFITREGLVRAIETDIEWLTIVCYPQADNTLYISGFKNDVKFEKVEENMKEIKSWKVVITPDKNDPEKTTLKHYEDGVVIKEESVRRFHKDKYSSEDAARAVIEKAFSKQKEIKTPKYKTGDKVVVKKDLPDIGIYNNSIVTLEMSKHKGRTVTIESVRNNSGHNLYEVEGVNSLLLWTEEIFEGLAPKYYNGKIFCVDKGASCSFTTGKIYEVKDGILSCDNIVSRNTENCYYYRRTPYETLAEINKNQFSLVFAEVIE